MTGINPLIRLEETGSTNAWAKAHLDAFGPVGAVYTTSQTAGRGRRGHSWTNAAGQALYYTAVLQLPLADPAALPLYASLAVAGALRDRYGARCQIKWPNDLLLNGKKIVGILCESVCAPTPGGPRAVLCGIGINLAQPAEYFAAAGLPHATSLALEGLPVDPAADADALAREAGSPRSANMALLGAAAPLLGIDAGRLEAGIRDIFARKGEAVVEANLAAFRAGYETARKQTAR